MPDPKYVSIFVGLILIIHFVSSTADKKCSQHIVAHNNQIILTKKSEENGAKFLKTEPRESVDDCLNLCCKREDCTVAVFENKDRHICYMFNCKTPNVCSFRPHGNYVTLTKVATPPKNQSHQTSVKKPVGLGASCGPTRICSDASAACTKGVCYCREGFIQKQGKCVKSVCPKPDFEFQCDDPSQSPSCVAIYDTCNGIPQCGDSSDEKNCVTNVAGKENKPPTSEQPQDGAKRREERPQPPPPPKKTTAQEKPTGGQRKVSSPPPRKPTHKKGSVIIYANRTDQTGGSSGGGVTKDAIDSVGSSEYVAMLQKSYQQSKIAVVVLGLTLGVTAFALAFFICRVRRIKNRLRRGKALTSDEADYLINGMYL